MASITSSPKKPRGSVKVYRPLGIVSDAYIDTNFKGDSEDLRRWCGMRMTANEERTELGNAARLIPRHSP
jgi:hypothetical protein